ncbi:tRNA threonylcarbamoyladenosine biosynthesis protein TsaB [Chitinophaga costaii]|uniref:N(6)-L-threonylcarbamoyladenine synthase n=1 Tax=Chitinophaga costaii TaxID=1335309 RepID=A0A1C4FRI2_9BACT|nr:tRNA (adenosine(37)-N6)-threonylcarbamoyltransferase complex dimerization subunit type 1 TsaB [Chitinophaga costaii]PUZ20486.1 tRNA (adenosine(37)-N6)-threonylcarbamoyltransferase complex dimerization subunit type 1 TsaB [Chitinophaga costaii]SCC58492.1 tRNA threonylcarbamoyladenosine biosynthesis protein TsaB [Chitinophaga costaii]
MATILHIDTATTVGSVCLSKDGQVLQLLENPEQREQAASITLFVQQVLKGQGMQGQELDAIAVSAGPGSYTGLRIGLATAKGLCYTWQKPLIGVSTLQLMAQGALLQQQDAEALYCPMIDARRMEVFTAIYNARLETIVPGEALILSPDNFQEWLATHRIYFFGDGSTKWEALMEKSPQAAFLPYQISAAHMVPLAEQIYAGGRFEDVAYFSPHYLKAFYHPLK